MDGAILLWIQENLRVPVLNSIFVVITHLGDRGLIWIILSTILLSFKRTRRAGICGFTALNITLIGNELIIKHLINRPRPVNAVEGLTTLINTPPSTSFPSGHTASSVAVALVLCMLLPKKYAVPAIIPALLICFSRMYVGVHYPTDILGGMIIGLLYGFAGYKIGSLIYDHIKKKTISEEGRTNETRDNI